MTLPDYRLDCPHCGRQVTPVALGPDTAPWLCGACHTGWWSADLTVHARSAYRPAFRDFGIRPIAVHAERHIEVIAAAERGTSVRADNLGLLNDGQVAALVDRKNLDSDFAVLVKAEYKRRGL